MLPSRQTLRRMTAWAGALSLLAAVYVLSVGPAILIANRTRMEGRWLGTVYTPVIWLGETRLFEGPFRSYMGYFQELDTDWDLPPLVQLTAPPELADAPAEQVIAGKEIRFTV